MCAILGLNVYLITSYLMATSVMEPGGSGINTTFWTFLLMIFIEHASDNQPVNVFYSSIF